MSRSWSPPPPALESGLPELDPHGGPRHGEDPAGGQGPEGGPRLLDFSTNVLPFPPDPGLLEAFRDAPLHTYPDPASRRAREAMARHWAMDPERIALAPGGGELIHRTAATFVAPGQGLLIVGSTFGEYRRAGLLRGALVREVGRGRARLPDPDAVVEVVRGWDTRRWGPLRLVFLCSPNNPTGDGWPDGAISTVADALPTGSLLVLDESYRSFATGDLSPPHRPIDDRILHIRSLTKDLALPGLRVAVAAGSPEVLELLERAAPPWAVSAPAQRVVEAAVRPGPLERLGRRLEELRRLRVELARGLEDAGWSPRPSTTGFILSRVPDATAVIRSLEARGIRVRDAASFGLPGWVRVGSRTGPENGRLLEALNALAPAGTPPNGTARDRDPGAP